MMRPAQILTLIVAGGVLVGAGLWLVSRQGAGSNAEEPQGPVLALPQQDLNAVTRLRIFKGDGSHTTLTRETTGWLVSERGYPADTGQVRKLLLDLSALQVEEQKTAEPALYSKLGVEDPSGFQTGSTGLDIDIKGKTLGLIVGHSYGTRSVYLRVHGQGRSVLATPQLAPDADPRHWLDRSLLDIAPERVTEVDMKPAGGPEYTIRRAGSAYTVTPIPKGREPGDPAAPASQAGALAGLQLDDVRKGGSLPAVAHGTFVTGDGLTLTLSGIQEAEQRYITIAAAGASPTAQVQARDLNARLAGWEFEIPGYRYESLFHPLEQLLKPQTVAAPAGPGTPAHSPAAPAAGPARLPFGPQGAQDQVTPQQSH
jgi:Domain of unknown function (DUF4340)